MLKAQPPTCEITRGGQRLASRSRIDSDHASSSEQGPLLTVDATKFGRPPVTSSRQHNPFGGADAGQVGLTRVFWTVRG